MKIGIIGAGNVGTGLTKLLVPKGHEIMLSFSRDLNKLAQTAKGFGAESGSVADTVPFADVVVIATQWIATKDAIAQAGNPPAKKVLWDCTNALQPDMSGLAIGLTTSGAEETLMSCEDVGEPFCLKVAADSTVWNNVASEIARKTGANVVTYDRAGLGKIDSSPGPYKIHNEVAALDRGLRELKLERDLIVVAHSYGGFLAALLCIEHPQEIRDVVLIDANLASFFTDEEVSKLMTDSAHEREELRKTAPTRAKVLDALPETARRMRSVEFPKTIPCLVIAAERPPVETPEEIAAWKRVHEEFVGAGTNRKLITAPGSGHFVMRDAPELVIDAITDFVTALHPGNR